MDVQEIITVENNLIEKKYWSENWKNLRLPAKFLYYDYSRKIITQKIGKHVSSDYKSFVEIGGCPGRWADYFCHRYKIRTDSIDYDERNIETIKKNYKLLDIEGKALLADITKDVSSLDKYDIVLSDGLVEHFRDFAKVFENHVKLLNNDGLLIVAVPNIKQSFFYNFFSRFYKELYMGFRDVSKEDLEQAAQKNGLKILYSGYLGVFSFGLVNHSTSFFPSKSNALVDLVSMKILKLLRIKRESRIFSPFIYLIAKL